MVPEGWDQRRLDTVFKLTSGTKKPDDVVAERSAATPFPVYGGNGVLGYSGQSNHPGNVIVIGRVGEYCGITRLIEDECWITDNALFARDFFDGNEIRFTTYRLQHFDLSNLRSKSGQPLVSQKPIYATAFPLPPLPEQRKIADILSTWDAAIEKTEALLATARAQKRALMQSLLTGKRRFPEFEGQPWNEVRLGDVLDIQYGKSPKEIFVANGSIPVVGTGGITGRTETSMADGPAIVIGRKGTIDSPQWIDGSFWCIDTTYYCKTSDENDLGWVFAWLGSINLKVFNEASGVPSLSRETLRSIKLSIPPLDEQRRVSGVFKASDEEIAILSGKIAKLRTEKKALMQQLLTGKRRVVV